MLMTVIAIFVVVVASAHVVVTAAAVFAVADLLDAL